MAKGNFHRFKALLLMVLFTWPVCIYANADEPAPDSTSGNVLSDMMGDYEMIYEHNMFSRDRQPPSITETETQDPDPIVEVEAIYVLRGIAVQKDERIAFIEEVISGRTIKEQTGSEVLQGRIVEIRPDLLVVEENGQTRNVRIGGEIGKLETLVVPAESDESLG